MSKHIKRIAAPKTWKLLRKENKFAVKPKSSHKEAHALPIITVLRDMLGYVDITAQAKKVMNQKEIMIDGKIVKDKKRGIGVMDVLSIKSLNEHYRILIDKKGKLCLKRIPESESRLKICRIINKKISRGKKKQYGLHDGRTILAEENYNIGDSLLIEIPSQRIVEHFKLDKGVFVYVVDGKYRGVNGVVEEIKPKMKITVLKIKSDSATIETLKSYVIIVGNEKPKITIY
ncbi:MAG: 30S ribosomal protein S4e [Candidatus Woesearchaeota archaeon]